MTISRKAVAGVAPVRLVEPVGIRRSIYPQGSNRLAIPHLWVDDEPELPGVWELDGAHVFGGAITGRADGYHWDGQATVTADGELFPGSYGLMDGNRTLARGLFTLTDDGPIFSMPDTTPRHLEGEYVLLGNVHPHIGHVIVEGLTRLWAASRYPGAKWLVYEPELRPFAYELLALAGIPRDRVVHASLHDVVERLIVPDPGMRTHRWITTAQTAAWDRVARPAEQPTRRVFLSRANVPGRVCRNQAAVEELFAGDGWDIVHPEKLSIREQVELAGSAERLAGLVGSQMYLAAFQPPGGRNIVIAPQNFFLKDNPLIASARDHHLDVVLGGPADFTTREREWDADLPGVRRLLCGRLLGRLVAPLQLSH